MKNLTNKQADAVTVMVVDDSALMRKLLKQLLERDPGISVIDTAMDGEFALDHLAKIKPDVVLLDIDMPRLDGLATLDRIVAEHRIPVVMCSGVTTEGAEAALDALRRGAVDFIAKPSLDALRSGEGAAEISNKIRSAAAARTLRSPGPRSAAPAPASTTTSLAEINMLAARARPELVAIGTSTGGPIALEQVIGMLPADFPLGIVVVQHMPAGFTSLLAARLDRLSRIRVREAVHGDLVEPGLALVSPGASHMRVVRTERGLEVELDSGPLVSGHRPSVDVLMASVAEAVGARACAVMMTGMGSDGAEAFGRLAAAGALTIVQSPDSCVCFGMPKSVIDRNFARAVLSLSDIASALVACGAARYRQNGKSV